MNRNTLAQQTQIVNLQTFVHCLFDSNLEVSDPMRTLTPRHALYPLLRRGRAWGARARTYEGANTFLRSRCSRSLLTSFNVSIRNSLPEI